MDDKKEQEGTPKRRHIVKKDSIKQGLITGQPEVWHKILMCFAIVFVGLLFVFGIMLDFLNDRQVARMRNQPVVDIASNANLPQGDYYIYQVFLDPDMNQHYLVSMMKGGVVVSAVAPKDTAVPKDILAASKYDPAAFVLRVDKDGKWQFLPTSVYTGILKKQGIIPDVPAPPDNHPLTEQMQTQQTEQAETPAQP